MAESRHDIITRLQREIQVIHRRNGSKDKDIVNMGLDLVENAFPEGILNNSY